MSRGPSAAAAAAEEPEEVDGYLDLMGDEAGDSGYTWEDDVDRGPPACLGSSSLQPQGQEGTREAAGLL